MSGVFSAVGFHVKRDVFVAALLLFLSFSLISPLCGQHEQILTINGLIPTDSLGKTLIHEHVFLDWSPADSMDVSRWDNDASFVVILPYLQELKSYGVRSFFECTPSYLGRNPALLLRLAKASDLQIITNTGFYAARKQQHLPGFAKTSNAHQLADIWIDEFNHGIDGTGVRPGFIKIGVDSKSMLDALDRKIVRAAAITHLETGLTIVAHTGTDTTAVQELEILQQEGVHPSAFVWTHAQRGTPEGHVRLAKTGAWISLDGMGWVNPVDTKGDSTAMMQYVSRLQNLKDQGLLNRVLISHDAGWYTVGQTDQSNFKPYTFIFDHLIPMLESKGWNREDFNQVLVSNPQTAYAIKKRTIR